MNQTFIILLVWFILMFGERVMVHGQMERNQVDLIELMDLIILLLLILIGKLKV